MASSGFEILGRAALASKLLDAADVVGDDGAKNVEQAAETLRDEVRTRAPVDTGELRDSYQVEIQDQGDAVVGRVYSDVAHAMPQEFIYTPHVRPAFEATRSEMIDQLGRETILGAFE